MSRRRYPYYHDSSKLKPGTTSICDVTHCEEKATKAVTIEVSWMRGDDLTCRLCEAHAYKARRDVDGLCSNVPQEAWK